MATPEIPTYRICRYCNHRDNAAGVYENCEKFDYQEQHVWISACERCGQFVHERGCADVAGTHVSPIIALQQSLVEIDAVLSEAGVPQEFAGQPLTLPERVRWLVRAVETNREAFRRQVKGRAEERAIWAEKKLQYERQLAARGRKLIFLRRIPAAKGACVLFDREYRNAWTHEEFSAFLKRHASQPAGQALWAQNPVKGPVGRIEIGERAETRCPKRSDLNGRQCTRAINHEDWHCSEGCSWPDERSEHCSARCPNEEAHQCKLALGHEDSHESGRCSWMDACWEKV